jgi:hypothetical protein
MTTRGFGRALAVVLAGLAAWWPSAPEPARASPPPEPDWLYVMNADGTDLQPLSSRPGIIRSRPSWAPDGSRLVAEVVYSQEFGLWQFDARRAAARNLTEGESGL